MLYTRHHIKGIHHQIWETIDYVCSCTVTTCTTHTCIHTVKTCTFTCAVCVIFIPVRPTFFLHVKHRFLLGTLVGGEVAVKSSGCVASGVVDDEPSPLQTALSTPITRKKMMKYM